MLSMFVRKPLDIKSVETFALDVKQGDYIPDAWEPKDFSKSWRVTSIQTLYGKSYRKLTLQRDKMVILMTLANEDKLSVFPKPKQSKSLRSIYKRDLLKDFLWLWFTFSLAVCAYVLGKTI